MILADKIINERKKCGWSQEELAEKLSVSRQSVSKWEGAQSVPDLNKIILMAEIFGVSTDYLLKDDIEPSEHINAVASDSDSVPPLRKVSMEEANEFMELKKKSDGIIAWGVVLCICSPAVLLGMLALNEASIVSESAALLVGLITLFVMICVAVFIFICYGSKTKKYHFLYEEDFETEYGVTGMLKEKRARIEEKNNMKTAFFVLLIIVSAIPLVVAGLLNIPDSVVIGLVDLLLLAVATSVYNFIKIGAVTGPIAVLLQEGEFSHNGKRNAKKLSPIASAYWCLATAVFLGYSFITRDWGHSWIVWPVAGVFYAVVASIAKMAMKLED